MQYYIDAQMAHEIMDTNRKSDVKNLNMNHILEADLVINIW